MRFISRQELSYMNLTTYLIFCLCLCGGHGQETGIKIYRSRQDIFENFGCKNDKCTKRSCERFIAECFKKHDCRHCRCSRGEESTFITNNYDQTEGKCESVDNISGKSGRLDYIYLPNRSDKRNFQVSTTEECTLRKNFKFTRDGQNWKSSTEKIFAWRITNNKTENGASKLKMSTSLKPWSGSLLKYIWTCGETEKYVLFKLESWPPFHYETESLTKETTCLPPIAIALPVAVFVIILVVNSLLYFVCYRKQKRKHNLSKDQDQNQLSVLVPLDRREPSTRIQPFQPYEEPCKHQYEYVDKTAFPLPQPFTYEYATGDKALKHDRESSLAPNKMASHVMRIPHTERRDTHDGGYVIERPDTEGDIHDGGYVIERPGTEGDIHDGGYVIERPDTEGDIHDGGYVIERPDTEGDIQDGGYVIERPDMEETNRST